MLPGQELIDQLGCLLLREPLGPEVLPPQKEFLSGGRANYVEAAGQGSAMWFLVRAVSFVHNSPSGMMNGKQESQRAAGWRTCQQPILAAKPLSLPATHFLPAARNAPVNTPASSQ
jgi:hypothetical protein